MVDKTRSTKVWCYLSNSRFYKNNSNFVFFKFLWFLSIEFKIQCYGMLEILIKTKVLKYYTTNKTFTTIG